MLKNTSIRQITGGSILDADYPRKGSIFHSGSQSLRIYKENKLQPLAFDTAVSNVPIGVAHFPKEFPTPPRSWPERCFRVERYTEMPRGGHFAALEQPELLTEDIRAMFRPLRKTIK